jgi:hypothetical protein
VAGLLTTLDVLAYGCLWHATGNLAAPALAALAVSAVDTLQLHAALRRRGGGAGGRGRAGGPGSA